MARKTTSPKQAERKWPGRNGPPDEVDIHVGERLRIHRLARSISQTQLGNALKITFQQVQKYEKGTNRMSASRMVMAARILKIPVSDLFGDYADPSSENGGADPDVEAAMTFLTSSVGHSLVRAAQNTDPNVLRNIVGLLEALNDVVDEANDRTRKK